MSNTYIHHTALVEINFFKNFQSQVKPHILNSNGASSAAVQQSIPSGHSDPNLATTTGVVAKEEDSSKYAALSSYLGSPTHDFSDPGSPPQLNLKRPSLTNEYPFLTLRSKSTDEFSAGKPTIGNNEDGVAVVMESILKHRKNLRQSHRIYKVPFMREKKKRVREEAPLEELRYLRYAQSSLLTFHEIFLTTF